jgi:WD40 repeat protein
LWDLQTGRCIRVLDGHLNGVNQVAITSDCRVILSFHAACPPEWIRHWDETHYGPITIRQERCEPSTGT